MLPSYFSVIPVAGKTPLVPWTEFQKRLATAEEKAKWGKTDIGIVTGPLSRIFVLDIDGEKGAKSIEKFQLPRTWKVKTPHGLHIYFRWTSELEGKVTTRTNVLDGVDVRGDGGYVKFYGWITNNAITPLANPPQWLLDLLPGNGISAARDVEPKLKDKSKIQKTLDSIKEGNRNESFTKLAGSLRARGYKVEEIFILLQPKAKEIDFPERELQTICNSVGRYEPKVQESGQGMSVDDFLNDIQTVEWICEGLIAKGSIGFVAGLPETGKTWCLIDLAIECARGGGTWLKKFPVRGCKVLLIDQERAKSETQRRIKAVLAGKGLLATSISSTLFVRCGTTTRIDLQHSFDAFRKELSEIKPDIVIVDSFATWHTREESNRMEIQFVLEKIKQLRNEFGCTFLFVHHETKMAYNGRKEGSEPSYMDMAGNVALPAAAETCFSVVKRDDTTSFVHHTKSTLGPKVAPFLIRVIDLDEAKSKICVEAF